MFLHVADPLPDWHRLDDLVRRLIRQEDGAARVHDQALRLDQARLGQRLTLPARQIEPDQRMRVRPQIGDEHVSLGIEGDIIRPVDPADALRRSRCTDCTDCTDCTQAPDRRSAFVGHIQPQPATAITHRTQGACEAGSDLDE